MRAVFKYPGSKWSIAKWIIERFPSNYEKMVYLEPFVGSGAVFFNKRPSVVETINDIDSDIANLFRVMRNEQYELKRVLELTPFSREEYELSFEPTEDPVEKARRFMIRASQAIGAKTGSRSGWRNHKQIKIGGTACTWNCVAEKLDEVAKRLRGTTTNLVQIEHMDALKLIERYSDHDVLIYIDPPYVGSSRKSGKLYKHEMNDEQHVQLLEIINRSQAKIIISGYMNDLYADYLKGWKTDSTTSQITSTEKVTETVWMNYTAGAQLRFDDYL